MKRILKSLRPIFKRLLAISGLTAPVNFCVAVFVQLTVPPIVYCLDTAIDAIDPPKHQPDRAKLIRELARVSGFKIYPLLLTEREQCGHCHHYELFFVMPDGLCWSCWQRLLEKYGVRIIERSTGKPVK